nr:MAG TPA: hypothetical protein [Caudoviricetes sp.]
MPRRRACKMERQVTCASRKAQGMWSVGVGL